MSRFSYLFATILLAVGMSACSSGDRSTASDDEAQVYRPALGETRHIE